MDEEKTPTIVGVIICKLDLHKSSGKNRGYIAMLAVHADYRKQGIGKSDDLWCPIIFHTDPLALALALALAPLSPSGSTLVKMALEAMKAKEGEEVLFLRCNIDIMTCNLRVIRAWLTLAFVTHYM